MLNASNVRELQAIVGKENVLTARGKIWLYMPMMPPVSVICPMLLSGRARPKKQRLSSD